MAATSGSYLAVLHALLDWEGCDAVLAVVGSSAQFHPQLAVEPIVAAATARQFEKPNREKPIVAFLAPDAMQSLIWLAEKRVPAFRTPEACADALAAYFRWGKPVLDVAGPAPAIALPRQGRVNEADALQCFSQLGIAIARSAIAHAPHFEHDLPYPVVAKISSPDIAHKTEAGGVALGLTSGAAFRTAAVRIITSAALHSPAARLDGVLVQSMAEGVGEAILGYRHDDMVGPIVLVGVGGTLAELISDTAEALAPVSLETAYTMIDRVRGFALLRGFRGKPAGDLEALAKAVVALSQLACVPGQPVAEAEINPLVVRISGVVAVDGLLVMRPAEGAT